jgi:hypothetical protein
MIYALLGTFIVGYTSVNIEKNHQLRVDGKKLVAAISEPMKWVETLSIHMGRKIIEHNDSNDLDFINDLFRKTLEMQGLSNRLVSWSMLSWSDQKHRLLVNTLDGVVLKNPEDLTLRQYTWRARYNPWMLQIAQTSKGILSDTLIIPVAVGVSNSRDEFQGAIVSGINAKKLLSEVEQVIDSGNAFLVVNRDSFYSDPNKVVIASANSPHSAKDYEKLPDLVERLKDWIDPYGKTPITIAAGRFKYSQYALLEGQQMAVLVGFNRIEFWQNVFSAWMKLFISVMLLRFLVRELKNSKK